MASSPGARSSKPRDMEPRKSDLALGKLAYKAYAEARGNVTFDGKPMLEWDELGDVQNGWVAAALFIAHLYDR